MRTPIISGQKDQIKLYTCFSWPDYVEMLKRNPLEQIQKTELHVNYNSDSTSIYPTSAYKRLITAKISNISDIFKFYSVLPAFLKPVEAFSFMLM